MKKICTTIKLLNFLGERYVLSILYVLQEQPKGFNQLQERLDINTATLTKRLCELEQEGILTKRQCVEDSRHYYYQLTAKGSDIAGLIGSFAKFT